MQIPNYDFHIHTKYLKCANGTMEIDAIAAESRRVGATRIGITDHLNRLDQLELHRLIRLEMESMGDPGLEVFFGVELNFLGPDGGFAFNEDIKAEYGFQFAIGGIHGTYLDSYDMKRIVDVQHRHHLLTCEDPLVDVLVHPYWFSRGEFEQKQWPWPDSMPEVPESHARELGCAARETGTAIELNVTSNLMRGDRYTAEYMEFLSIIAGEGAMFSIGSDAHDIGSLKSIALGWSAAGQLGLTPDRIWTPGVHPLRGGGGS